MHHTTPLRTEAVFCGSEHMPSKRLF